MNRQTFLIIGAGLAGASAVSQLRKDGFDGAVVLVGEELEPPYERPPLSKAYLRGEAGVDSIAIRDPSFYTEHDVDLRLSTRATAIRPASREVLLDDGSRLGYDRLLIATGSSPRRLDVPGHDLPGIHHLRTRADSAAIRQAASHASRASVVGAGWIGSEVAASLRQLGLPVAMIGPDATPLEKVLGPEVGGVFRDLHAAHGVDLSLGLRVVGFEGSAAVAAVRTSDGRRIAADLVVVGIGARPQIELAVEAGLDVGQGILVDEQLESSVPGIFAAGDVAEMWHPALKTRLRVEHQDNARRQGRAAARNMLGKAEPYVRLPYFYSDQYDLGVEYRGYAPAWDSVVTRGDLRTREFLAFWLADGRVMAAMNANTWDVGDELQELVDARRMVDPERLADPDVPISAAAADRPRDRAIPSAPSPMVR
jgi:3-phenylpropionate/trans-cinnamate dioxygenase ferredoxin reductase subunit